MVSGGGRYYYYYYYYYKCLTDKVLVVSTVKSSTNHIDSTHHQIMVKRTSGEVTPVNYEEVRLPIERSTAGSIITKLQYGEGVVHAYEQAGGCS